MKKQVVLIALLALSVSCALNKKVEFAPGKMPTAENEKGGILVKDEWIKNKEKSIEFQFDITNGYDSDVTLKESSFILEYNGQKYGLRTGSGDLEMRSTLNYQKVLIFKLPPNDKRHGKVTVSIEPITKGSKTVKPIVLNFDI